MYELFVSRENTAGKETTSASTLTTTADKDNTSTSNNPSTNENAQQKIILFGYDSSFSIGSWDETPEDLILTIHRLNKVYNQMILENCFMTTSTSSSIIQPMHLLDLTQRILVFSHQFSYSSQISQKSINLTTLRYCVLQELLADSSVNLVVTMMLHLKPILSIESNSSQQQQSYHLLIQSRGMTKERTPLIQSSQFEKYSQTIFETSLWGSSSTSNSSLKLEQMNYKLFVDCLIGIFAVTSKEFVFKLLSQFIQSNTKHSQVLFSFFDSMMIENTSKHQKVSHLLIEWLSTRFFSSSLFFSSLSHPHSLPSTGLIY